MNQGLFAILVVVSVATSVSAQKAPENFVWIDGGSFANPHSNYFDKTATGNPFIGKMIAVDGFYIGNYEVTQMEWRELMGTNPSKFQGDYLPVETVSWYDFIEYCNQRSLREGLKPCYALDRENKDPNNQNDIDTVKWIVTLIPGANGYRLPTEAEWEYAASGGRKSRNYTYSGGDDLEKVAWYWANSGDQPLTGFWSWPVVEKNHNQPKPVGTKAPNELGLYDMSGNVREWCWNWYGDAAANALEPAASAAGRVWRGGGWMGGDFCCASAFRAGFEASGKGADQGFRVCRDR